MSIRHIRVGTPEEIEAENARKVLVGKQEFLVTRLDGEYVAFSNVCPHQMFELWAQDINGPVVQCVGHGYTFDIRTGQCVWPFKGPYLNTLPVEELGGQVCIRLEEED